MEYGEGNQNSPSNESETEREVKPFADPEDAKEKHKKKFKWSRQQILTGISMSLINFTTQISFAVIAPFFPVEGENKGATSTEIGLIFGVFQLVIFLTAPIYGKFVSIFYITMY